MVVGRYRKIKIKYVIGVALTVFIMATLYLFFSYTMISSTGILHKENVFQNEVHYRWDDVQRATVFCSPIRIKRREKYELHYVITEDNGEQFDLKHSYQFWSKVILVDNLLKKKSIPIDRRKISEDICHTILDNELVKLSEGLGVLRRIMSIEYL